MRPATARQTSTTTSTAIGAARGGVGQDRGAQRVPEPGGEEPDREACGALRGGAVGHETQGAAERGTEQGDALQLGSGEQDDRRRQEREDEPRQDVTLHDHLVVVTGPDGVTVRAVLLVSGTPEAPLTCTVAIDDAGQQTSRAGPAHCLPAHKASEPRGTR